MHILMLARSSGDAGGEAQAGVQEALFWAWWCVEGAIRGPGSTGVAEEVLFPLIEVCPGFSLSLFHFKATLTPAQPAQLLSTVSALSPDPATRFLAFRLLSTLVIDGTAQEETQLMLLKDLVDDCPFEAMRVAALGLLQEVLLRKFQVRQAPWSHRVQEIWLTRLHDPSRHCSRRCCFPRCSSLSLARPSSEQAHQRSSRRPHRSPSSSSSTRGRFPRSSRSSTSSSHATPPTSFAPAPLSPIWLPN